MSSISKKELGYFRVIDRNEEGIWIEDIYIIDKSKTNEILNFIYSYFSELIDSTKEIFILIEKAYLKRVEFDFLEYLQVSHKMGKKIKNIKNIQASLIDFNLRNVTKNDVKALAHLLELSYYHKLNNSRKTFIERDIFQTFNNKYGKMLFENSWVIQNEKGELCAAVLVVIRDGNPFILHLATLPKYRRRGIGKSLLLETERSILNKNFDSITFYVRSNNIEAVNFYRTLGYEFIYMNLVSFRFKR